MKQIIIQREDSGVTIEVGDNTTTDHIRIRIPFNGDVAIQTDTITDNTDNQIATT